MVEKSMEKYLKSIKHAQTRRMIDLMLSGTEFERNRALDEASQLRSHKSVLPAFLAVLKTDASYYMRKNAARELYIIAAAKYVEKEDLARIKKALFASLFDLERSVRLEVSEALVKLVGARKVAGYINKRYPEDSLSKVPAEFFLLPPLDVYKAKVDLESLRRLGSPNMKELVKLARKKQFRNEYLEQTQGKYAWPDFFHRGLPVFLRKRRDKRGNFEVGIYNRGMIYLSKQEGLLPKRFRRALAEHEFGEIFGHDVGNALMMIWLEERGLFKEFLEHYGRHEIRYYGNAIKREMIKTIEGDSSMNRFRKYFPELKKRKKRVSL